MSVRETQNAINSYGFCETIFMYFWMIFDPYFDQKCAHFERYD
jgi:hypothetical protein